MRLKLIEGIWFNSKGFYKIKKVILIFFPRLLCGRKFKGRERKEEANKYKQIIKII
jgi:hypothetical protein